MRKAILALLFCAASSLAAFATQIGSGAAQKFAESFFSSGSVSAALPASLTRADNAAPAYYVFNNASGGWVIVAGDDCCEPILAYSESGSFNASNLPPNFSAWMDGIKKNVEAVRKAGLSPQKTTKAKWAAPGTVKGAERTQKLIETASWGQKEPFNNSCPAHKKQLCLTGCVATAMAIVLRHNQYPASGVGTIPAYTTYTHGISVPSIPLGTTYNWENMPLVYTSSATSAQKNAVSKLMYHCGAMVGMDYGPDGSSAFSSDIIPALTKYMGYNKTARELYRYDYSNTDWFNIIKAEIDANRVIIYGGEDYQTGGGHQFVLDGYDSNNMVHINWGWYGSYNAWYAINYLGDTSSSGVDGVFSYGDSAIIGLEPEKGTSTQNVELSLEGSEDNALRGISLNSGSIAGGAGFELTLGFICNYDSYNEYSGAVKVGLYDRHGALKEYVCGEQSIKLDKASEYGQYLEPGYTSLNVSCSISSEIALGDYLMPVYKLTDGSWAPLGGYNSDEFTKKEQHTLYKLGAIDLAMLNVPDEVYAGQVIYFDLVGSHNLPSTIKWYWDGSVNSKRFVEVSAGDHTLKAVVTYVDGTEEAIRKVIKVK